MKNNSFALNTIPLIKYSVFDVLLVAIIYFLPTLSHLMSFPLYLADPMRIMILFAFIHTNKLNAFILALTLPMFSHLIALHPVAFKSIIISFELVINCFFLILFLKKNLNTFFAFFFSIIISKCFYYGFKYTLLSNNMIEGNLISTSLEIQLLVTFILSIYGYLILSKFKK
ncbi:MAG: hypothetical protein RO257_02490 [Candidatus Kapabacteria bacterium]|nr:hypothetical protein [Candidatus Kapabacteria bacterium]